MQVKQLVLFKILVHLDDCVILFSHLKLKSSVTYFSSLRHNYQTVKIGFVSFCNLAPRLSRHIMWNSSVTK